MSTSCIPEKTNNKTKQDSNLRRDETKIQNKKDKSSHDKTRTRQEESKSKSKTKTETKQRWWRGPPLVAHIWTF
jgi:hypothetical protein